MNDETFIIEAKNKFARGTAIEADKYTKPILESYQGNPLIEALPAFGDDKWFAAKVANKPDWKPTYLDEPWTERIQMPVKVKRFFMPLDRHYSLVTGIYTLIKEGYQGRNPLIDPWQREKRERLDVVSRTPETYLPDEMDSAMVTGMSGLGKSITVARVLQKTLPQVIQHKTYANKPFPHTQIVWLYLSCPSNASSLLCSSMLLREIDIALKSVDMESDCYGKYVKQHSSSGSVFNGLCEVALEHSVGLIVIDELQNLTGLTFGGVKPVLNFIFQLQNTLGVPVLMVSNGSIFYLLAESFRNLRRTTYIADPNWGRFKKGSLEWDNFVKHMWQFQYLKTKTELNDALKDALYEQTAGIPDLVGDLFKLVQMRAIRIGKGKDEIITPDLIQSEARDSLRLEKRQLIKALQKPDWGMLGRCDDMHITDFANEELTEEQLDEGGKLMGASRAAKERNARRAAIKNGQRVTGA